MEAKICKRTLTIETLVLLSTPFPLTKKLNRKKRTAHVSWFNIGMWQASKHREKQTSHVVGLWHMSRNLNFPFVQQLVSEKGENHDITYKKSACKKSPEVQSQICPNCNQYRFKKKICAWTRQMWVHRKSLHYLVCKQTIWDQ